MKRFSKGYQYSIQTYPSWSWIFLNTPIRRELMLYSIDIVEGEINVG
jgi:hypothetical protein